MKKEYIFKFLIIFGFYIIVFYSILLYKQNQLNILSVTVILILTSGIFFYLGYKQNQKNIIREQVFNLERCRFKEVIEAEDNERQKIAKDLHDSIGQMLSVAKMYLSDLNLQKFKEDNKQENLIKSIDLIDEACEEIRNISYNLMPASLTKVGLIAAIRELERKNNKTNDFQIKLNNDINFNRFDEKKEIAVYKILQEIINSSIKYSEASKIDIDITKNSDLMNIIVKDDGQGFNLNLTENTNGIGWKNIYSRLNMINGNISIDTLQQKGMLYKITVPI